MLAELQRNRTLEQSVDKPLLADAEWLLVGDSRACNVTASFTELDLELAHSERGFGWASLRGSFSG